MTRLEAIAMGKSGWWENATAWEIAAFQLREERLCMPWNEFQKAVEAALGRGVFTHEFVDPKALIAQLEGDKPAPTLEQTMDMIPAEKRIVMDLRGDDEGEEWKQ